MKKAIGAIIKSSIETKSKLLDEGLAGIEKAVLSIESRLKSGGRLLIFGNGGSAADSQHIAAEFVGRFKLERNAIPALALTTNTSTLTALANDYGYEATFKRQIEALGGEKDAALAISTSGNAANVIEAVKAAREKGLLTVALTGKGGGALAGLADISITVSSNDTARVQEAHILIGHIIAELIESRIQSGRAGNDEK